MHKQNLQTKHTHELRIPARAGQTPILVDVWRSPVFGLLAQACNLDMTEITDPGISAEADMIAQEVLESVRCSASAASHREAA